MYQLSATSPPHCLKMAPREKTTPLTLVHKLFLVKQIRDNPVIHRKQSNYSDTVARQTAWVKITENFSVNFSKSQQQLKRTWKYLNNKLVLIFRGRHAAF